MSTNIAAYIDHTVLKPTTAFTDIEKLCAEAKEYHFAAVCVPPYYVALAKHLLEGTKVKVATVVGFPFGYSYPYAKLAELQIALAAGADELDMVHNIAAVKNNDWETLLTEVSNATKMVHEAGKAIKIIVESGDLTDNELIECCTRYAPLKIDFMKTSTGYSAVGATVKAVQIMRSHLPGSIAIKASGGIRDYAFAQQLIDAGATRLGCSASVQIVKEALAG